MYTCIIGVLSTVLIRGTWEAAAGSSLWTASFWLLRVSQPIWLAPPRCLKHGHEGPWRRLVAVARLVEVISELCCGCRSCGKNISYSQCTCIKTELKPNRIRSLEAATASKQPQSMDSQQRAMILIEVAPSKQPQRSSFEAATLDGFSAQGNDSHRNRSFEAATAQLLRSSHNRWIHCTGAMILIGMGPSKQPQQNSFVAATIDGLSAQAQ